VIRRQFGPCQVLVSTFIERLRRAKRQELVIFSDAFFDRQAGLRLESEDALRRALRQQRGRGPGWSAARRCATETLRTRNRRLAADGGRGLTLSTEMALVSAVAATAAYLSVLDLLGGLPEIDGRRVARLFDEPLSEAFPDLAEYGLGTSV
jgi:hypothetical protein